MAMLPMPSPVPAAVHIRLPVVAADRDPDVDLDRVVWDPDYRRSVIDQLAREARSRSGDARRSR